LGCQDKAQAFYGDVIKMLERFSKNVKQFDIIFADPPYKLPYKEGGLYSQKLLSLIEEGSLLKESGRLFIEEGDKDLLFDQQRLKLQNCRKYGNSYLYQFVKLTLI
jgi:16S rRNA G966 N2-methylase RsmD